MAKKNEKPIAAAVETQPVAEVLDHPAPEVDHRQVMANMLAKLTKSRDTDDCHAYLLNHDVPNYDLSLDAAGNLLGVGINLAASFTGAAYIPKIKTLLSIPREGKSWLEPGTETIGAALMIGHQLWRKAARNPQNECGDIYVMKDYATGAAVHQITNRPVAVSFTSANLRTVGVILREKFPKSEIIFFVDSKGGQRISSLLEKAWAAAQASRGLVIVDEIQKHRTRKGAVVPSILFLDDAPLQLSGKKSEKAQINPTDIGPDDLDDFDLAALPSARLDQSLEASR